MPISIRPPTQKEAINWQDIAKTVVPIMAAFFGGWFTHRLTQNRESNSGRISRKRDFLAFLREWLSEFRRAATIEEFSEHFGATISIFSGEAQRIRRDFNGPELVKFDAMVAEISKYIRPEIYGVKDHYKHFMEAIDALIKHLDA